MLRDFPWYRLLFRPVLFRLPPEHAQSLAEIALGLRSLWRWLDEPFRVRDEVLQQNVAGLRLANPIGLAAGYDKQCRYLDSLGHLGFGYVIGGTVTLNARHGNPRPRLLRRVEDESLVNSMGFPSDGLFHVERRLRRLRDRPARVLVSIAALDVESCDHCFRTLEPLVDAVELNISSPNTAGVRRFQQPQELWRLLGRLNARRRKPLFVKLPPYRDEQERQQVMELVRCCVRADVSGVTAVNTLSIEEPRLATGQGGLSGRAIFSNMLRTVADVRREVGSTLVVNACGGIATVDDAWRALQAGADTVQLYTGLVYQGPAVAARIAAGLARQLHRTAEPAAVSG